MGALSRTSAGPKEKRPTGRPLKFDPTPEQGERIKELWYERGIYLTRGVVQRASQIMGHPVNRAQLDYRYGPRDGSMPEGRRPTKEANSDG